MGVRRVGIVGYGGLGQFLVQKILEKNNDGANHTHRIELCFVWNRSWEKISKAVNDGILSENVGLKDLSQFAERKPDLVVEVAHPDITKQYGKAFLQAGCDFFVGSPTAFADETCFKDIIAVANDATKKGALYLPVGALWGAHDIQRMADRGILKRLCITMKKHPSSLKLGSPLAEKLAAPHFLSEKENVVFSGSVKDLCPLAPNNVNTMACAAIAAHNLGFDKCECKLIADDRLLSHDIEIDVFGPENAELGTSFKVSTLRVNPAKVGAVTGQQTFVSFFNSLLSAKDYSIGVHFC